MKTVHDLRKAGYKVTVTHFRYVRDPGVTVEVDGEKTFVEREGLWTNDMIYEEFGNLKNVLPCGGMTSVTVESSDGKEYFMNDANCSKKDNYSKKLGVKIALGRILKQMEEENVGD